ncbi:chondroitin AC/alginate lyase [Chlamydoabsidia padenii]|nr:chondroitin AC/alginate lyase [Chlamydoabsidia padenii]
MADLPVILTNKNKITVSVSQHYIPDWKLSLNESGVWPDVDYTSGCSARKAYWPARKHLERLESMASVWYSQKEDDDDLLSKILLGLNYWFKHDFNEKSCVMLPGTGQCPCGTPGLWNLTWYSQVISIPRHIGNICLLLVKKLSPRQTSHCIKFTSRSYSVVDHYSLANLAHVAYNGITLALLLQDPLLIQDCLDRTSRDAVFALPHSDGIQVDGSYLFHREQLYNGNYGEDQLVNLLAMYDMMGDSTWSPSNTTLTAFMTLLSGSEWMMVNAPTGLRSSWMWQYSALSRMISFKSTDQQGSAGILLDMQQLDRVATRWSGNKEIALQLTSIVGRLNHTTNTLTGTRYFWNADYLVHRSSRFVTTLKMVSTRTTISECLNGQNLMGYRLNDGSLFTYRHDGIDYMDIFGAWDWNHVPGTTILSTTLTLPSAACNQTNRFYGNEAFVGAAVLEQQQVAVAVMNFTDPHHDDDYGWQKTFFFFPLLYAVHMDPRTNGTLVTTLDQRRQQQPPGTIYINGIQQQQNGHYMNVTTLAHDHTLYSFDTPVNLTLESSTRISNWSSIGASQGNESVDIWSATVATTSSLTYFVQPFGQQPSPLEFITSQQVRGAYSPSDHALALAFWAPGSITLPWVSIDTIHPLTIVLQQQQGWVASISDPTQSLSFTTITVSFGKPRHYKVDFPQGAMRGRSVIIPLN